MGSRLRAAAWVAVVVCALTASGSAQAQAPRDWATRHGVDTGGPTPGREVPDPRNVVPHTDVRPGQDRVWIGVTTALVGLVGFGAALGVWLLEGRRRLRHGAEATARAIDDRFRREADLVAVTAAPGKVPLWAGDVEITLRGVVGSDAARQRALEIAGDEARHDPMPTRVVDRLSVDRVARRVAG